MSDDIFKKIGNMRLPKIADVNKFNIPKEILISEQKNVERFNKMQEEQAAIIAEEKAQEKRHKQEVLNTLKNIEKNTGDISSLVALVQNSNNKQKEILDVLKQIMEISQSKTEEEADKRYRNVMDKANQLNEDVETATKLISYGNLVWLAVKEYLKNPS